MSDVRLEPAAVLRHRSGVLFRELEGEAVLLDLDAGTYFGLNEVGTRAWALIGEGVALGGVREVLLREYEVAPERLWEDLLALVGELLEHRLVELAPL